MVLRHSPYFLGEINWAKLFDNCLEFDRIKNMDTILEIVKNTFNSNISDEGDELVKTAYIKAPNSYKLGQYKTFNWNGFSLEKVANHCGFTEVGWDEFPWHRGNKEKGGALGVSTIRGNIFDFTQIFAINPESKFWEVTCLHEFGHLILGHCLKNVDEIQGEIEANLFSYFATKELDFPNADYALIGASLKNLHEIEAKAQRGNYPENMVKNIREAAKQTIKAGS